MRPRSTTTIVTVVIGLVAGALLLAQGRPGAQGGAGVGPFGGQGGRGQARAGRPPEELPKGTAIMRGAVVAADTGTPVRRAQVRVSSASARESRLATTDAQGRFEVKELPAGRYTVSASKGGYVSLQYGQRRPSESGTPIELSDGQTLDKLVIALPRGSVIGGRVSDEFGEPVANAVVSAMRYGYVGGSRRLVPAGGANSRDTTDDQGQYRLFGLPPGEYVVSAQLRGGGEVTDPMGGEASGYAATYYPGTPNVSEAQRVTVAVGQENVSVSFGLIATKLVKVSGQVLTAAGAPAAGGAVMLMPVNASGGRLGMVGGAAGRIDGSGAFRVTNVAPGRYQVQARSGQRFDAEFGKMDLTVGADDVEGVVLMTSPGGHATGLVVSDTGEPLDFRPQQVQIGARLVDADAQAFGGAGGAARVGDDWTFELTNLTDARLIRVGTPQGWTLKSVTANGQDITDTPVEFPAGQTVAGIQVVLTKKVSTLTGAVTDAKGNPVLDATVVVFPSDERLWTYQSRFIRAARPDQEGQYRVTALPPSDSYLAIAVQGLEDGQAGDPEFLASLKEKATKFSVAEGEQKSLDVKLSTEP